MKTYLFAAFTLLIIHLIDFKVNTLQAQTYDLLIKNGHVIDPRNKIDAPLDVAVKDGKIARVAKNIAAAEAKKMVDAKGLFVTPGLLDIHGHHFHGTVPDRYLSNSFTALPPDGFTFPAGVTTAVDAGGAGWSNFLLFKEQVIDRSDTRLLAFINIVGEGMRGVVPYEQNLNDLDPKMTALVAKQYPEIVGIKIAHYRDHDWEPYRRAVEAGKAAGIPVMVDLGGAEPALLLEPLFNEILRPGDILTHMYGRDYSGHGPKESALDSNGKIKSYWLRAQERGLIFDVGHGGGSFYYDVAVPATKQGLWPNTISTDLHTGSMNGGMKNMLNVVSKMMNLGMSLPAVINASTWKPAQVIQREDLGHLSEGAEADIAVFRLLEGNFGFLDSEGQLNPGKRKLETELTIRAGKVVWDLNGIASTPWDQAKK
ncbi:amidohydrolase/deacetylase family metallohydrolase [soil metagenome]